MISGKTILITGGTGSFGRCMVEHLLNEHDPAKVIVFSRGEEKQVAMQRDLPSKKLLFFIGDVRDQNLLRLAFRGVDYVIHAAALKHIDVCQFNPIECKKTNIDGAVNIVEAAIDTKVEKVLGISSDKAVNPTSTYGASKFFSDNLLLNGNLISKKKTRFSIIRFGNFENSSGSVIQYFHKLKAQNSGKLPITDKRMTRYFLSIEDAVKYSMTALKDMRGGEVYIPKMRKVRIDKLAHSIYPDAELIEVGRRLGEKLNEDLISEPDMERTRDCGNYYVTNDEGEM